MGTALGIVDTATGGFAVLAPASPPDAGCCIESLTFGGGQLFFGGRDRVGTIDPATGAIVAFPDLGNSAIVDAMTFDDTGTLFASSKGTGVGVVDTATGGFVVLAPAPPFPDAGCCIESLTFGGGQLFFGGRDRVGTIDPATGAIVAFPDLGNSAIVDAMTFDDTGTLFASSKGTGVGIVDTATGGFVVLAPAPPPPSPPAPTATATPAPTPTVRAAALPTSGGEPAGGGLPPGRAGWLALAIGALIVTSGGLVLAYQRQRVR